MTCQVQKRPVRSNKLLPAYGIHGSHDSYLDYGIHLVSSLQDVDWGTSTKQDRPMVWALPRRTNSL